MKKVLTLTLLVVLAVSSAFAAKKYKFEMKDQYSVFLYQEGKDGVKVVKAIAIAKNADKAIEDAKMDAVASAIFFGFPKDPTSRMGGNGVPAIITRGAAEYDAKRAFFDEFFKTGQFLNFVYEVNSTYPSGQNNMQVPGGRKVTIMLGVRYDLLRKYLEENGIKNALGDYFGG